MMVVQSIPEARPDRVGEVLLAEIATDISSLSFAQIRAHSQAVHPDGARAVRVDTAESVRTSYWRSFRTDCGF
jgi:hypothetical protein